jgi:hypothetical protein
MKCCGKNEGHTDACATYWHDRQRQEVEKRVLVEQQLNNMVTKHGTELGALAEAWVYQYAHLENELFDAKFDAMVARQAFDGKQPALDIWYHKLFSEQMVLRKSAESKCVELVAALKKLSKWLPSIHSWSEMTAFARATVATHDS